MSDFMSEEDFTGDWEPDDFEVYNQNEADDYRHEDSEDMGPEPEDYTYDNPSDWEKENL